MPTLPQTAKEFEAFMVSVWDGDVSLYDQFHDAIATAKLCGAARKWPAAITKSGDGYAWDFSDGSRVYIRNDGAMVRVPSRRKRH